MPLSSKFLAKIINSLAVPLFVINANHKVTHWNPALEGLTGVSSGEAVGQDGQWKPFYRERRPTMADLIVDRASPETIRHYYPNNAQPSALIDGAYEAEAFFPHLWEGGAWLHFTASPIVGDDGVIVGALETILNISQRKRMEENLRIYSQQLTQVNENERMHLARELHDELSQIVGSASRHLDNLLRKRPDLGETVMADLEDIRDLLKDGSRAMNRMIKNLRPPLLDDLGLIPALRSLCTSLENTEGVVTRFEVQGQERRLDAETELLIFRIVQEALQNIGKHAGATEVSLVVAFQAHRLRIEVTDNGRGFDIPTSMHDLPRSGRLGLMGMQERIWLLGGTLDMSSHLGQGTTLTFIIPCKKNRTEPEP